MCTPQRQMYPNEQFYLGVKRITAWPATNVEVANEKGQPGNLPEQEGYAVQYPDGYLSWSPKDVFEKAYLPIGLDGSKITQAIVDRFMGVCSVKKLKEKSTLVCAQTIIGFEQYEVSSCVDPANYDQELGRKIAEKRIKDTIRKCLGFVLQWAKNGIS